MNHQIRRVAQVFSILFAALLLNLSFFDLFLVNDLNERPQNRRVRDAQFAQDRGAILAGNLPIAETVPVKDGFNFQRVYPRGAQYAPITGFYSYDYGRTGLEQSYNTALAGTDSSLFFDRLVGLATGRKVKGASIETTLVPAAQKAAWKGLGGKKGAVVAIRPSTGEVLAYVSTPSYDPNLLASHDIAATHKAWDQLTTNKGAPMADRAGREVYPPGSTFKVVTAAAALSSGITPDTLVPTPASMTLPGTKAKLGNSTNCGNDKVTLTKALELSCNTSFANLALRLGPDALAEQAKKFGFGQRLLPELNAAPARFPKDVNQSQLAMSGIGQYEVAASALQMAAVGAAVVNDGKLMQPYLVKTVRAPDLSVISTTRPSQREVTMTPETAKSLNKMMISVVEKGTGKNAKISGLKVGGKTGTAQSAPNRPPYAWFLATSKEADVAVGVFVQDAGVARHQISGGRLAAPIARSVIKALR